MSKEGPNSQRRGSRSKELGLWLGAVTWLFLAGSGLTSSAVELPRGFVLETLATNLDCVTAIAPAPDGRVFIAEQTGVLRLWKEGKPLDAPALQLRVTDYWERGLVGVTLAPDFPRQPHLFVLYVTDKPFVHHVLSRFTVNGDVADPASERVMLEGDDQAKLGGFQPGGHQGGPLRFGPDGKLYVGLGEQTAGEPSQRLDTLQGKILRLNADGSIPEDNPFFTKSTGKYRAIWAYGIRNPFGLAVQSETGRMFFTDVGGSAFEEVNELARGANYGWPNAEGPSTNAPFRSPLYAYPPVLGRSVCGGVFYPAQAVKPLNELDRVPAKDNNPSTFPEKWRGRFFFLDFMNHWLKALDPDNPTNVVTFARGFNGPIAVEMASDGSLLVLNRATIWRDPKKFVANAGSLVRIRYVGAATSGVHPPARSTFTPALGLPDDPDRLPHTMTRTQWDARLRAAKRWPFWLNTSAWQPFTHELIGLYFPTNAAARLSEDNTEVLLPPGAVVVRHFSAMDWEPPERRKSDYSYEVAPRWLETRLLVVGQPRSYGASYRWKTPDRAELVEDGELETFADLLDTSHEIPRKVSLSWWFPAMDDGLTFPITNPAFCISTAVEDFILAANPNRADGADFKPNWLRAMRRAGVLQTSLSTEELNALPSGTMWVHPLESPEKRVRSYLHGNCAVCHQPGGASRGSFDARLATPLARTGLIHGQPAAGDLGLAGAKLVVPGSPEKSILYQRLKRTDFFRMPPVQYHNEPSPILPVMEEWIRSLKPE